MSKPNTFNRYDDWPEVVATVNRPPITEAALLDLLSGYVLVTERTTIFGRYVIREYHNAKTGDTIYIGGDFTDLDNEPQRVAFRAITVILIALIVITYSVAVISGAIPKTQQVDSVHLALIFLAIIVCAVILQPRIVDRLGRLEGLGFKIELLQRLQERQVEQAEKLYDVDLLIPLLFRDSERKHLSNLTRGTTKNYKGGSGLRDELRRLRSIGLLKSLPERHVADLHSDTTFDLADWVSLTDFGRRWAERLNRLEQAADEAAKPKSSDTVVAGTPAK